MFTVITCCGPLHAAPFWVIVPVSWTVNEPGVWNDVVALTVLTQVAAERRKRISTAEMNRFLADVDFERATVPYSRRAKILYATQVSASPKLCEITSPRR